MEKILYNLHGNSQRSESCMAHEEEEKPILDEIFLFG